jgi:hypothetical protein
MMVAMVAMVVVVVRHSVALLRVRLHDLSQPLLKSLFVLLLDFSLPPLGRQGSVSFSSQSTLDLPQAVFQRVLVKKIEQHDVHADALMLAVQIDATMMIWGQDSIERGQRDVTTGVMEWEAVQSSSVGLPHVRGMKQDQAFLLA